MKTMQENITELNLASGARVFIAPTGVKDIVTIKGSVLGGPNHLPKSKSLVSDLTSELLDAGTKAKNKEVLRRLLAGRGISLSFSSSGDRTHFEGSCLPENLPFLLSLMSECLSSSLFLAGELKLAKERMLGDLIEEKSDTRVQSAITFSQLLYDIGHVNYKTSTDDKIKSLQSISRSDIVSFARFGQSGMVLAIVGDIDVAKAKSAVHLALKKISIRGHVPTKKLPNTKLVLPQDIFIKIADKATIDTRIGAALPINSSSPAYLAQYVLTSMLGGAGIFSGFLTQSIRERDGLTYHIRSSLLGMEMDTDGLIQTYASFSPTTFAYAVEKTKKEIDIFYTKEITQVRLQNKQDQLTGSYKVGLSTTSGLATALHSIGVDGKTLSYIDEYPKLIRAVTLAELNSVAKEIPYGKFSVVAAGALAK